MNRLHDQRALWLATHVLPHEAALRARLSRLVAGLEGIEVDDVVQESYAALAELEDVGHIDNPGGYLFTVARTLVLQHVRRARIVSIEAVAEIDLLGIDHEERSPERHAAASQELRRIGALLAALPERCREAFVLRKVEGLSQREIARRMGVSENTVEKHIGKGLKWMLDGVAADAGPEDGAGRAARTSGAQPDGRHERN